RSACWLLTTAESNSSSKTTLSTSLQQTKARFLEAMLSASMDLQLKDKVVVITGGAKGIGGAITRACAEEAAIPAIVDRDQAALAETEKLLSARGKRCLCICVELSNAADCRRAI